MGSVAIFWDLENVTPTTESLFIDGLWDHAESFGRVAAARAYCDWSKPEHKRLGPALARLNFYLVHVPRARGQKNAADMSLLSDTLEVLSYYDHIDTFVLVTGDSDFRPLVLALRRAGKKIQIVCDIKKASQDLLSMADSFKDYRELIPGVEDEAPAESAPPRESRGPSFESPDAGMSLEDAFELLAEAAAVVEQEGKVPTLGTVKTRVQMLNPNFNEKPLGFKRWSEFVARAARSGVVRITETDQEALVYPAEGAQKKSRQVQAFDQLVSALSALDQEEEPGFHVFARVDRKLRDANGSFDLRALGFRKFKEFIQAAEARGLVESRTEGLKQKVKMTAQAAVESKPKRRSRRSRSRSEGPRP